MDSVGDGPIAAMATSNIVSDLSAACAGSLSLFFDGGMFSHLSGENQDTLRQSQGMLERWRNKSMVSSGMLDDVLNGQPYQQYGILSSLTTILKILQHCKFIYRNKTKGYRLISYRGDDCYHVC